MFEKFRESSGGGRAGWVPAFVFLVLYYVLFLHGQLHSVTMELTASADAPGTMMFFWPDDAGEFTIRTLHTEPVDSEVRTYRMTAPLDSKRLRFRFDPDDKVNVVRVNSLRLTGLGREVALGPAEIIANLSHSSGLSWQIREGALVIRVEDRDGQLFFSGKPLGGIDPMLVIAPLLAAIALVLAGRRFSGLDRRRCAQVLPLAAAALLVLFWGGRLLAPNDLATAVAAAGAGAVVLIASLILLREQWRSHGFRHIAYPGAISALFVAIVGGLFFATTTPGTLAQIGERARSAFLEHRGGGLDVALRRAREALEEAYLDAFAAKDALINLNAESKIFGMGFSPTPKAIVGKDGWFFEGYGGRRVEDDIVGSFDNITDYMGRNPFSEEDLEAWRAALEERYYWLKERGIRYVFALAPTKAHIYPEKMPDRILDMKRSLNRPTRYDQLIGYLKERSEVPVVDLRAHLLRAREERPGVPLYYRTDFHWNYHGSLVAYRAIVEEINRAYPELGLDPAGVDDFVVQEKNDWVHARFMYSVGLDPLRHQDETYFTFMPKPGGGYDAAAGFLEEGISDYSLPESAPRHFGGRRLVVREVTNPDAPLSMMFVIGDSFIGKTVGYFSRHARRVVNFRVVTQFPIEPYTAGGLQPEVVVQEVLNMYLLQPPPVNPREVREARARAMAADLAERGG